MVWYIFGEGFGNVGGGGVGDSVVVRAMEEGFGIGLVEDGIRYFKNGLVEYGRRVQVANTFV